MMMKSVIKILGTFFSFLFGNKNEINTEIEYIQMYAPYNDCNTTNYRTGLKFGPKRQKLCESDLSAVGVNPYRGILFQSIV